jgi:hypothetical protein
MPRRKTKNQVIQDAPPLPPANAYVTWDDTNLEDKRNALKLAGASLDEFGLVEKSTGRYRTSYVNLDGPTSGRPGLTRRDYEHFRPDEAVPQFIKHIFIEADDIYNRCGLVKNVIDLMGDFACQGVRLVHTNKKIERFYRRWFDKVNGEDRSERFLNNLYRIGNVVVNRQTAKIKKKTEDELYKAVANPDLTIENQPVNFEKKEIPWKYTFIDPTCVDVACGALASFVGKKIFTINLPAKLRKAINNPKTEADKIIISQLPPAIVAAAKEKTQYILDMNKTLVYHYKKDDWKVWAFPMIYSIMDDIYIIEKLKLADLAALDGAISNIRIFKLGSLEHKIAPTPEAASRLHNILQNNVGGGSMDLVWGPDIDLLESKTTVHQFLGEAKYTPHLNSIYAGLGIPPTLTGTFGANGTTNNFISLKTLTQRLQYGRKVLTNFWNKEIELVQKAMGFAKPAKVEFDRMDLSNEEAEKALLIQLADRNIVSDELVQRVFGYDPDIEQNRINRETRERKTSRRANKAGPWFDPEFNNSLKKIALQSGLAAPSQVGLELIDKKSGEKSGLEWKDQQLKQANKDKLSGIPGQGRPKNKKDQKKRKPRTFAPQTGASINLWAISAQDSIAQILNPTLLKFYNKKNMRSLSDVEYAEAETIKTKILLGLKPNTNITEEYVLGQFENIDQNNKQYSQYKSFVKKVQNNINRELTSDEAKYTKAYFYELVYTK